MIGQEIPWGKKLTRLECDITEPPQHLYPKLDSQHPEAILCLASLDLRQCQENPIRGISVNCFGNFQVAEYANKKGIPFIQISTGSIFFGEKGKTFTESDTPCPQHTYGQSKVLLELLTQSHPLSLCLRTGWLFGGRKSDKIFDVLLKKTLLGEPVQANAEQWGSPTYLPDLIRQIEHFIESQKAGTFHVVNEGGASALEFVEEAKRLSHSTSEVGPFENPKGMERSPSEVLTSNKGSLLRPWKDALKEYIERGKHET